MTVKSFHIAVDGPSGTSFPSFPSHDLENGVPQKIALSMIRRKCQISSKLFFTADGKSRISDDTKLDYYMSLTAEGQTLLRSVGTAPSSDTPSTGGGNGGGSDNTREGSGNEAVTPSPVNTTANDGTSGAKPEAPAVGVQTLTIKVTDGKTDRSPKKLFDLPGDNAALGKLLESISNGTGLQRGALPTFADRALASLKDDYSVKAGSGYKEPAELTEQEWDTVFRNNRALYGYNYDYKNNILVKARKPAFKLRGAAPLGTGTSGEATKPTDPTLAVTPIPPFYIQDDASVDVTEARNQFQHTAVKEGFSSTAWSANIGGGTPKAGGSVSGEHGNEHGESHQKREATDVGSLIVTYNFPRVVVDLEAEDLELTDECKEDAMNVVGETGKQKFLQKYGTIFASQFTLGGYLHSTKHLSAAEKSNLDQTKDKTRIAAGVSIQTPKVSGGLNYAKVDSTTTEDSKATLYQEARLAWDAKGGDTLLCSNPPLWASTVKDYRLWRLMNQNNVVEVYDLIRSISPKAFGKLEDPDSGNHSGKDIIKDRKANKAARTNLMNAISEGENNRIVQIMQRYYRDNKLDQEKNIKPYNEFVKKNFPDEAESFEIEAETLFGKTDVDQKVGLGFYLHIKGVIEVV